MNVTRPIIENCVDVELKAARKEHEDFHSLHEAYAVTLEEVYEAQDEYNAMGALTETLWSNVRADDPESFCKNMVEVEKHAINLAAEAVQVAAMARKARNPSVYCDRHLPFQGRQEDKNVVREGIEA